ncbi:metalloregulator ArsR/SmtB family transcription factor [Citricoccus sp. NPDC055426]|uniref:ArsR/SmtB family transcription factor n=1 Tax=Citricoccus sp. NPDC055426 TaxID=3155536 RepID=UPI0034218A66
MAMSTVESEPLDEVATAAYAHLFQALAEPTRLTLVQHLASGEHRVRDLVDHLGLAQSTVSKHLGFLLECGLVTLRPEGRSTWYSLAEPARLRLLISAAEELLRATGTDAVLCTHLRRPHRHGPGDR